ncbi:FadR family transcriptional regulator [Micrococcales bacterium 31B]|nr:FadR family transcriptional regulator [Micrococcales bacterium 31B]
MSSATAVPPPSGGATPLGPGETGADAGNGGGAASTLTERLLDYVASQGTRPGEKLPGERKLAEHLGVARHVLRESLRTLHLLGFVDVRQGDGTYWKNSPATAMPRTIEWQMITESASMTHLIEARAEIEVLVCTLAATRASETDMAQIRQRFEFMVLAADAGDVDLYSRSDISFHLAIAKAAGNSVLEGVLTSIRSLSARWTESVLQNIELSDSLAVHEPIMNALSSRDPLAASLAMRAHMDAAAANLLAATSED